MAAHSFATLPSETVMGIFSLLDLQSLVACESVSKNWQAHARDDRVWRNLATRYNWARTGCRTVDDVTSELSDAQVVKVRDSRVVESQGVEASNSADEARARLETEALSLPCYKTSALVHSTGGNDYYEGLTSFKDLCMRSWCLSKSWSRTQAQDFVGTSSSAANASIGHLQPIPRTIDARRPLGDDEAFPAPDRLGDVWRLKVCPRDRILLSTQRDGGICVSDLRTGDCLWRHDQTREHTHIEYDRGYFIVDGSLRGAFEIFRARRLAGHGQRGEFEPYAQVTTNHPTRALRFQYPYLCTVTRDGYVIFVDVRSRDVVQKFRIDAGAGDIQNMDFVQYVDFDDDFVFVVGLRTFWAMSRKLGRIIWSVDDYVKLRGVQGIKTYDFDSTDGVADLPVSTFWEQELHEDVDAVHSFRSISALDKDWQAVHPDFRTNTLVALSTDNVVLIRDYVKCFQAWERRREQGHTLASNASMADPALQLEMFVDIMIGEDDRATYQLAVAESRAFCTGARPMLIDLDPTRLASTSPPSRNGQMAQPPIKVYELVADGFVRTNHYLNHSVPSCVQMDGGTIFSVQLHFFQRWYRQNRLIGPEDGHRHDDRSESVQKRDVHVWDFAAAARSLWPHKH